MTLRMHTELFFPSFTSFNKILVVLLFYLGFFTKFTKDCYDFGIWLWVVNLLFFPRSFLFFSKFRYVSVLLSLLF